VSPGRALIALCLVATLALTATSQAATSREVTEPTPSNGDCVQGTVGLGVGGTTSTDESGLTGTGCVIIGNSPPGSPAGGPAGPVFTPRAEVCNYVIDHVTFRSDGTVQAIVTKGSTAPCPGVTPGGGTQFLDPKLFAAAVQLIQQGCKLENDVHELRYTEDGSPSHIILRVDSATGFHRGFPLCSV
jgi:hypothetical protein